MSYPSACPSCQDLTPISDEGTRVSLTSIARSATAGCDSCRIIRHAIHDCVPQALVSQHGTGVNAVDITIRQAIMRHFVEVVVKWEEKTAVTLDPVSQADGSSWPRIRSAASKEAIIDLLVENQGYNPWPSIRVGIPTSGNTISNDSFRVVEGWLQKCLSNHASCRGTETSVRPKRVLDLSIVQPNVLLTETPGDDTRYVCLSHCWGDSRIITTTMESMATFRSAITFSRLPRTFQQAITFTRKLGVRYLWIDSLCIIQDSESDWQEQSALMANIYANSYLTLAATGSSSDDGGLFFEHPKATISGISTMGVDYKIHARPVIDHMDDAQFPLFKRAWVFQERLLAPRVLHFGRQELFWECNEAINCECGGIFGERYGTGQEKFMSKTTHQEALLKQDIKQLRRRWHAIVEEYSQLSLTKMRDRLPALAGIAAQMSAQRERRGNYLAGLWSDTLGPDLLWFRQDAMSAHLVPKWRAPTWSWANIEGQIRYFDAPSVVESPQTSAAGGEIPSLKTNHLMILGEVARASNPDNQFGEVLSAHLQLRGLLAPLAVFDGRSLSSKTLLLRRRAPRKGSLRSAHYEFRFENSDSTNSYPFFADYDLHKLDSTFTIATWALLFVGTDTSEDEYAIVLKRIQAEQNIYERVGLFTTKFSRWSTNDHKEVYYATMSSVGIPVDFTLV